MMFSANISRGAALVESERSGRVLHVLDHLSPASGVASVVMNCVTEIDQVRQDIAIYGQSDPDMEMVVKSCGGRVYRLPDVAKFFGGQFSKAFSQLLQSQPYTVVHGHLLNSAFIYLRNAKQLGVPNRIIHAHNPVSADVAVKRVRNNLLSLGICSWANNYIAVSEETSQSAFRRAHRKKLNVSVIRNGIKTDRFHYDADVRVQMRRKLDLREDTLCIGNVARFVKQKNHDFLIDVFVQTRKKTDCVLALVGEGPLEAAIKEKVTRMGLLHDVRFLGLRSDVERLYQAFDVFLLPSLFEGFGLAAVEAQCAGLGCVVSKYVPQSVVCSEKIRFLPLENEKIWADIAVEMANQCRSDGSVGVKAAKLNAESMRDDMLKIYQSMLGKGEL